MCSFFPLTFGVRFGIHAPKLDSAYLSKQTKSFANKIQHLKGHTASLTLYEGVQEGSNHGASNLK